MISASDAKGLIAVNFTQEDMRYLCCMTANITVASTHCVKYRIFTQYPGVEIGLKGTVS